MSGFASSIILSGKVFTPPEIQVEQEAAGKVGKVLGVIAAIAIPFAAPLVWGAIAGSTAIGASLAGAMTGVFGAAATNVIGSALVGGIMNAGVAYASGARGGEVWSAFGSAALSSGAGAFARGLSGANAAAAGAPKAGLNAIGGTGPVSLAPGSGAAAGSYGVSQAAGATAGLTNTAQSGSIMSQIGNIFSGGGINRIGAAITNAIVNGESQERLDALMAEQRSALAGLNAQEQAAYAQRMQAAEQVLAAAGRLSPENIAYMRMGDVAGVMNKEHDQALRNIAVRQGGSLDRGQAKAYERSGRLAIGRAKAQAFGEGYQDAAQGQAQLYGQAAGLFTGPGYEGFRLGYGMEADAEQARNRLARSTAGGFVSAFNEQDYDRSTSPSPTDPRNQEENNDDAFGGGLNWPNG